jgi:hypothetical protein
MCHGSRQSQELPCHLLSSPALSFFYVICHLYNMCLSLILPLGLVWHLHSYVFCFILIKTAQYRQLIFHCCMNIYIRRDLYVFIYSTCQYYFTLIYSLQCKLTATHRMWSCAFAFTKFLMVPRTPIWSWFLSLQVVVWHVLSFVLRFFAHFVTLSIGRFLDLAVLFV